MELTHSFFLSSKVYGVSFVTVMPTEFFYILESKLGLKRRFYPQGDGSKNISRVLIGDEKHGHKKCWSLDGIKPGEQASVYFAPSEGTVTWTPGPLDPNFDMPMPNKQLSLDDVVAVTQFEIDNTPLSTIILMAADPLAGICVPFFHLLPHLIMILFVIWLCYTAPKQAEISFYQADTHLEWINIFVIFMVNMMRKSFAIYGHWCEIQEALAISSKVHNDPALVTKIRRGAFYEFLNLMQDPIAFSLSVYVAVYMSDNLFLNVLLNIVALEFITEVDEEICQAFTLWRFGEDAKISVSIIDITYNVDESLELWHQCSNTSKKNVVRDLRSSDKSNLVLWELLTSKFQGLGLTDSMDDGREVASSFQIQFDIVSWENIPEETLISKGGLFLAATEDEVWKQQISKDQRAVLFKYFPEIVSQLSWTGSVKLDLRNSYGVRHARSVVHIANKNEDVGSITCEFVHNEADAAVAVLRDGLMKNTTLHTVCIQRSGLTANGVKDIALLLRGNSKLGVMWLLANDFGDAGAIILADALSEGSDANTTMHRMLLGLNNVSNECRDKCIQKTNGRMIFIPDEHLQHLQSLVDQS
mmetsp:Transcript_7686/g.10629  ORF Transcript_7686/g.10629 Transcript_7686/m.10629 type:complete len:586 (+) Transcript_7686:319-2076(+)